MQAALLAEVSDAAVATDLRVHRHTIENTTVLRLVGDLDTAGSTLVRSTLLSTAGNRRCQVVVDLGAVERLDPTGVALLRRAHRDVADTGGTLCFAAAPHQVQSMPEVPRFDNVDRALNWLYTHATTPPGRPRRHTRPAECR